MPTCTMHMHPDCSMPYASHPGVASVGLALGARLRVRRGAALLARWRARAGRRLWRARTVAAHCRGCAFAAWERVATDWAVQLADTVSAARRNPTRCNRGYNSTCRPGCGPVLVIQSASLLYAVQVAVASRRFHCARAIRHWRSAAAADAAQCAWAAGVVARRTARHYAVARLAAYALWAARATTARRRREAARGLGLLRLARGADAFFGRAREARRGLPRRDDIRLQP